MKGYKQHDQRYFAMLNNAVAISEIDRLEGGSKADAFEYYQYLLNRDFPDCPVKINLAPDDMAAVHLGIDQLIEVNALITKLFAQRPNDIHSSVKQVIEWMNTHCDTVDDACYLPSGWVGKEKKSGHLAILKGRKLQNGHFAFSVINQGAGISYHQEGPQTGSKQPKLYQSDEYEVDLADPKGSDLLYKLISIQFRYSDQRDPKDTVSAYNQDDLYGMLKLYGKTLPLTDKLSDKVITPQRGGSCTMTNPNAMERDILVNRNADLITRKRYHFVLKLRSLLDGYEAYQKGHCEREVFACALNEFAVRVNKEYEHVLSQDEVIYCTDLYRSMKERLDRDREATEKQNSNEMKWPSATGDNKPNRVIKISKMKEVAQGKKTVISEASYTRNNRIRPEDVFGQLINHSNRESIHTKTYPLLMSLPHTTGEETDPFWDKVPIISQSSGVFQRLRQREQAVVKEPSHIYAALAMISKELKLSTEMDLIQQQRILLMRLTAYDIAAQLFKHDTYTLGLDDVYSDLSIFTDPTIYFSVKRIVENFQRRAESKRPVLVNTLRVNPYLDNAGNNDTIHFVINHMLNESQRKELMRYYEMVDCTDVQLFEKIMKDMNNNDRYHTGKGLSQIVGREFFDLFIIAGMAQSGDSNNSKYDRSRSGESIYFFSKSKYQDELLRQYPSVTYVKHEKELTKHLPTVASVDKSTHVNDFSENVIYHPKSDLEQLRRKYKASFGLEMSNWVIPKSYFPYQLYSSGSLKVDSAIWKGDFSTKPFVEDLNEQFRQIECSPYLQIVRTLAWLTENPDKIQYAEVRTRLNELLFAYGRLEAAFFSQFDLTLDLVSDCFGALIHYYNENRIQDVNVISWLGTVESGLRDYAQETAEMYGLTIQDRSLPSFRDLFIVALSDSSNSKTKSELAKQIVITYKSKRPLTVEDCALVLICRIITQLGAATRIDEQGWRAMHAEVFDVIKHNLPSFNTVFNKLLVEHLKLTVENQWKVNDFGLATVQQSPLWIDFETGSLKRRGVKEHKDNTAIIFKNNVDLISGIGLSENTIQLFTQYEVPNRYSAASSDGAWFFTVDKTNDTHKVLKIDQIIGINGVKNSFSYQFDEDLFTKSPSPFESKDHFNEYYQYWHLNGEGSQFFVRHRHSDSAYFYDSSTGCITELKSSDKHNWIPTGRILLNLVSPDTELEKSWAQRLSTLMGINTVRCIASLSTDKSTCTVERIEHPLLGIDFTVNKDGKLIWDDEPEYCLSDTRSLEVIHGLPTVMIFTRIESKSNDKDRKIIIPAFALTTGDKNYAFDRSIIDYNHLCHGSRPYFEYVLDKKGELLGSSVESHMYLAMLYRSLGDYKRAIAHLQRCNTYSNCSEATVAIAMQAMSHPIKSPLGAAFDLKLNLYLLEHTNKWDSKKVVTELPAEWKKWISETQLPSYQKSYSSYKSDVSLFPTYLRLTADEFASMGLQEQSFDKVKNREASPYIHAGDRLEKVSRLPVIEKTYVEKDDGQLSRDPKDVWSDYVNNMQNYYVDVYKVESLKSSEWRIYDDRYASGPAFSYLFSFFPELLEHALSGDLSRVDTLGRQLYALLLNDETPHEYTYVMISLLIHASQYPRCFKDFVIPKLVPGDRRQNDSIRTKLIVHVGQILIVDYRFMIKEPVALIRFDDRNNHVAARQPLASDFIEPTLHFEMGEIQEQSECKHPLRHVASEFFTQVPRPITQRPFTLNKSDMVNPTPLEERLFEQYASGHHDNTEKMKTSYEVKTDTTLDRLKQVLAEQKLNDVAKIKILKKAIEDRANHSNENNTALSSNATLSRSSEQHLDISINDLVRAFLNQDVRILTKHNPFLTQEDIRVLFADLASFALLSTRVSQIDKSLTDLSGKNTFDQLAAYELQLLAGSVDKQRAYTIEQYPEFLVYEYATGRMLRDDQVQSLIKIISILESDDPSQVHHALLQFAAGGGKSSVLIPILASRIARSGYLPVIFNTNELYETGLEDIPKNLRESLGQNLEVIDRELDHTWTSLEVKRLLSDMKKWKSQGKCILMKPITWHSLNIARKLSVYQEDKLLERSIIDVLHFFKSECIKLEDESHIISDPTQQCIKTFAKPLKPTVEELELLLRFYDHLMGYEPGSEELSTLAGIKSNQKITLSPANLILIQSQLADLIANEACFEGVRREDLIQYLKQDSAHRPNWLLDLLVDKNGSKQGELIVLARAFIHTHLPDIVTKQDYKDYGTSIHQGDLTAAPKHEGKEVSSHFGDHILVAALTIQMIEARGLTPDQVDRLLDALIDEHKAERQWNPSKPTMAENWLMHYNALGYDFKSIRDIMLPNSANIRAKLSADIRFTKNPHIVKRFLEQFALPQIEVPSERVVSTPAEFQSGFERSLMVSATPGLPETYPAILPREHCFMQQAFEAQVIDILLSEQNAEYSLIKDINSPAEFFQSLPITLRASMTTLIDRGALLTDFDGKAVIEEYLKQDVRPTEIGVHFSKAYTHILETRKKPIDIAGTALVETLKKQGKDPEEFLLFLFMDLSKTTGVDIKRPFDTRAGLTIGKEQTVTELIQAAMRQRQLLDDDAQRVIWIMFTSLYKEIYPDAHKDSFDPKRVMYWMIKNEARMMKSKIINRAYQGIDHEITSLIWKAVHEKGERKHIDKLKQIQSIIPSRLYELDRSDEDAENVLMDYIRSECIKYDLDPNLSGFDEQAVSRIMKIVRETRGLISTLQTPSPIQMSNEVLQEMNLNMELKNENKMLTQTRMESNIDSTTDFVFTTEDIQCKSIDDLFNERIKPIRIPGCESIKQIDILFDQSNFSVIKPIGSGTSTAFDHYKPIEVVLVKVMSDGSKQYRACTAAEANYYAVYFANHQLTNEEPAYSLINSNGAVLHTSNNTSRELCKQWVKEPDAQKVLAYVNFLSGRVCSPTVLCQVIQDLGWSKDDYERMAHTIGTMVVTHQRLTIQKNEPLYDLCGWGKNKRDVIDYIQTDCSATEPTIIKTDKLCRVQVEKHPGNIHPPVIQNERALGADLFGETPMPVKSVTYSDRNQVVTSTGARSNMKS